MWWPDPVALDIFGNKLVPETNIESGTTVLLGDSAVHYTARDAYGNTATCDFNITISEQGMNTA